MARIRIFGFVFLLTTLITIDSFPFAEREITVLSLDKGRTRDNSLPYAVLDASADTSISFGEITWDAPNDRTIVRKFRNHAAWYTLNPHLDLGFLFEQALNEEAHAFGFSVDRDSPTWKIQARLNNVVLLLRPGSVGPDQIYAFLIASCSIEGHGSVRSARYFITHVYWRLNSGGGHKDEAAEILTEFLVDASQNLLALINRDVMGIPARSEIVNALSIIKSGIEDHQAELCCIAYSGRRDLVPQLVELLGQQSEADFRWPIINALGFLGDGETARMLVSRYSESDDEDERFFILKALIYLNAPNLVTRGRQDENSACRFLVGEFAKWQ